MYTLEAVLSRLRYIYVLEKELEQEQNVYFCNPQFYYIKLWEAMGV